MVYRIWDKNKGQYFVNLCGKSFWGKESNAQRIVNRRPSRFELHRFELTRLP